MALPNWSVGGRKVLIGNIIEDTWDTVTSPIDDAWNALKDNVPGFQEVSDAVDAVVTGPVRDFARTSVGRTILSVAAGSLTGGLAPMLGPQLATVAFAMPGMAAGESFAQAWTQEFASRVEQTAQILGTQYAGQISKDALARLAAYSDKFDVTPFVKDVAKFGDFKALAKRVGVREDFAALYLAGYVGDMSIYLSHAFDPKTGAEVPEGTAFGWAGDAWTKMQKQIAQAQAQAQRVASERKARLGDLGSFKNMLQPAATATAEAAHAAVVSAPAATFDRSVAPTGPAPAGLSTGAKVAIGVGGVGLVAIIVRALRMRRVI